MLKVMYVSECVVSCFPAGAVGLWDPRLYYVLHCSVSRSICSRKKKKIVPVITPLVGCNVDNL